MKSFDVRRAAAGVLSALVLCLGALAASPASATGNGGTVNGSSVARFSLPFASHRATSTVPDIKGYAPGGVVPQFQNPAYDFANGYNPVSNHTACLDGNILTMPANGTRVQTYQCNQQLQQEWTFHAVAGQQYWYTVTNGKDNQCLDADARYLPANGTKVQLYDCNGQSNQHWYVSSPDGGDTLVLQDGESLQCLDAQWQTAGQNDQQVQVWDCSGKSNQNWFSLEY